MFKSFTDIYILTDTPPLNVFSPKNEFIIRIILEPLSYEIESKIDFISSGFLTSTLIGCEDSKLSFTKTDNL